MGSFDHPPPRQIHKDGRDENGVVLGADRVTSFGFQEALATLPRKECERTVLRKEFIQGRCIVQQHSCFSPAHFPF